MFLRNHPGIFSTACGLAITLSAIDLIAAIWPHHPFLSQFEYALSAIAITAILIFAAFFILYAMRPGTTSRDAWIAITATFLSCFFLLVEFTRFSGERRLGHILFQIAVWFLISAGFSGFIFLMRPRISTNAKLQRFLRNITLSLPLIFLMSLVFLYAHAYSRVALLASGSLVIFLTLFCAAFIPFVISKLSTRMLGSFLIVIWLILVLSPLVRAVVAFPSQRRMMQNHKIKHVILITIDTLRYDVFADPKLMPKLQSFANENLQWTNAYSSASWTWPSFASIMTGHSSWTHLSSTERSELPGGLTTLAEYMSHAGYLTAAIGENAALEKQSMERGFDSYSFFPKQNPDHSFGTKILSNLLPETYRTKTNPEYTNDLLGEWLRSNANSDFFLWVHFLDPHCPYNPAPEFRTSNEKYPLKQFTCDDVLRVRDGTKSPSKEERIWLRGLYDAEAKSVDRQILLVITALKKLKLYDDALIVFTSDHGEEFWDHGGFEHGHSLYDELIHVPLVIKLPQAGRSASMNATVSTEAILPSILQLTGIQSNDRCLRKSLLDFEAPDAQPILAKTMLYYDPKISVRWNQYQYILDETTGSEELYNYRTDPRERSPISDLHLLSEARTNLVQEQRRAAAQQKLHQIKPEERELLEEMQQRLKSLGYSQ